MTTTKIAPASGRALKTKLARADGWTNPWTGQGTDRDKTAAGTFDSSTPLEPSQCADLYHGDPIAARIVDLVPREMMRQGYTFELDKSGRAREGSAKRRKQDAQDEAFAERARAVMDRFKDLDVQERVLDSLIWGRCMGAALLFIGVDDGQRADMPLDPKRSEGIAFLQVYDWRRVTIETRYKGKHRRCGEPEIYRITPLDNDDQEDGPLVHETRCIRFGGARTAEQERRSILAGRDFSVLQKVYDAVRKFHASHAAASLLMTDASQGVWKMAGFIDAITSKQSEKVMDRLLATDMGRSVARAIVLDADPKLGESFEKVATSFGGIGDMLDRDANYLAACSEIPVPLLIGEAPAGLNATGDATIRIWFNSVQAERENKLKPILLRLIEIETGGERDGWDVVFPSLWQESPKEKAEREKLEADRDHIRIDDGVVTAEEVALSPDVEVTYPTLDREMREVLIELDKAAGTEPQGEQTGKLTLAPTDQALVVTVNEARASLGAGPLDGPDGDLTVAEFKAKNAAVVEAGAKAEAGGAPAPPAGPMVGAARGAPPAASPAKEEA